MSGQGIRVVTTQIRSRRACAERPSWAWSGLPGHTRQTACDCSHQKGGKASRSPPVNSRQGFRTANSPCVRGDMHTNTAATGRDGAPGSERWSRTKAQPALHGREAVVKPGPGLRPGRAFTSTDPSIARPSG